MSSAHAADSILTFPARLTGSCVAGALLGALALVVFGSVAGTFGGPVGLVRPFLSGTGWMAAPLLGAAVGALATLRIAKRRDERLRATVLAVGFGAAALVLVAFSPRGFPGSRSPQGPRAIARAILKWSYRSPATVAKILPYTKHPNPTVREQAALALGTNLIVTDVERAHPRWPARFADHPLRDSLRIRLLAALDDPVEGVRAEAARALWKAQRAFGRQPQAAETLAVILDRAMRPGALERLTWLALDAAAGEPNPRLIVAAARFAAATQDSDLARVAREVVSRKQVRDSSRR